MTATEGELEAAQHVLSFYRYRNGVYQDPNSFTGLILHAYSKADPGNKARLAQGFPELAAAMNKVNRGDIEELAKLLD